MANEDDEEEFLSFVEGSTGDVDDVVVNVGEAVIVCEKVKVFGDL